MWQGQNDVVIDHQRFMQTIEIIIFPIVVDKDIIAHRFPKEVVGCSTHQGSLGIDFRVRFGLFLKIISGTNVKMFLF